VICSGFRICSSGDLIICLCISFMTLFYFNIMFLFIMFLVCSSYVLDIVLFNDLYLHMFVEYLIQFARELNSFAYVSVVLRYEIPLRMLAMCREVVDRVGDSCVKSFAVHPPYID
jgi:hypothetical protein